ncbi:MFS transporter [Mesorhizobium sp. BR1-1-16]|uniref:MFS transporter n=1 Tax=Mesorhizobium sp. BR1-1-16 TaxID=2876653 RepID=UPI001CCCA05D|nr:MFS transporter [Mesorhizobium sp. BR1-1-16]MBZ9937836.1 MFS transporter [Mesorhizobium sp. BR1-1-16]
MALSFASARLIMGLFFIYSFALSNWLIRIPDVQHRLDLAPGALALCLLGLPFGLVCSMVFAGPLVEKFGPRRAIRYGFVFYALPLMLPGFAFSPVMLFIALMLVGLGMGPLEVGMNVAADRIGAAIGRTVMSRCHGFWSVGLMAGGAAGTAAATFGLPPGEHIAVVIVLVLIASQLTALRLPALGALPSAEPGEKGPVFALPPRNIIALCFFAFGMLLVEGAITDWSAIYLRDVFGQTPPVTGFAFTAFGFLMAAGRLAGDWLSTRFGAAMMARVCCSVGLAGLLAMILAADPALVIIGAAAAGFGVSIIFPLAVTAAASRDGSPAVNVAALSLLAFSGFMVGPVVIGFVAEAFGLRLGLSTLLIAAGASLLLSGEVRVRPKKDPPPLPAAKGGIAAI